MLNLFALATGNGFHGGGGISSSSDGIQLPGLIDFLEIFENWLKALSGFWNTLNTPLGELSLGFKTFDGLPFGFENLVDILGFGDYTLLGLIIGGSLGFYVVYQLITWLLNIVT